MREARVALLVADIAGSTRMYELLGDAAAQVTIEACMQRLADATAAGGGRVVKALGDGCLCVLPSADAAMDTALAMRRGAGELGFVLRVAVHLGSVVEDDRRDVFGDAVNTVSRLADVATASEILVSQPARDALSPMRSSLLSPLPRIALRGKRDAMAVFVVPSSACGGSTLASGDDPGKPARLPALRLRYADREIEVGEDAATIGRSSGCSLVVSAQRASRVHCHVFRLGTNFYLEDSSSNGTWLAPAAEPAVRLHRERAPLIGSGRIHCGADPVLEATGPVHYRVGQERGAWA